MALRLSKRSARAVGIAFLAGGVCFAAGYYATLLTGDGRAAMIVMAALAIPLGITARSVTRGVIRGVYCGLAGGAGLVWALLVGRLVPPETLDQVAAVWSAGVTFLTTAVCVVFAQLAKRRRERMEEEWDA